MASTDRTHDDTLPEIRDAKARATRLQCPFWENGGNLGSLNRAALHALVPRVPTTLHAPTALRR